MTEDEVVVSMFNDEVTKLNEARQSMAQKIQATAVDGQLPASVAQAAGVMFQYMDTSYLWMTQVEQFIRMNSAENVESVAANAMAKGDVTVVHGGQK